MKKHLLIPMAFLAIFGLLFVSCDKDSEEHEYTEEELAEIARQDSLKKIIPVDYVLHQDITIPISAGYGGVTVTVDSAKLLELFEYNTVAELVAALGTLEGDPKVQTGNDLTFYAYNYSTKYEYSGPSTTNYFGHWFDANGDVCSWGDQAYMFCEKQDTVSLKFTLGIFPERPPVGSVYHIVEAIKCDTTQVAILFNVTIGDVFVPNTTVVGTQNITFSTAVDTTYAAIPQALDTVAIKAGIACTPQAATLYGINANGSLYVKGFTANNGCFFNTAGDVCNWGDEGCAIFAEYDPATQKINVGQYPKGTVVGQTYTVRLGYVNLDNLKQYNVVLTVTMTQ